MNVVNPKFLLPLVLWSQWVNAAAPDVTSEVQYLGTASGNFTSKLVQHRDRLYFINGAQSKKSPASYYNLSTGAFSTAGQIDTESPYGAVVKQGDLLWYGEDTTDGFNGSALHVITHAGVKRYQPPVANAHQQSQWIYDGKIFAADYYRSYPGAAISYNGGSSWSAKRLAGQNGFKATIDGIAPFGALVPNFFEFRGNLFCNSPLTVLDQFNSNGTRKSTSTAENFLMRYTGNPDKPWELAIHRFANLGFIGRPASLGTLNSSSSPAFLKFLEFKGYLFLEWYGVVNRYSAQMVTSLDNPSLMYAKPANPVVVANNLADSSGNPLPNSEAHTMSMTVHNGAMYLIVSPDGRREIRRSTNGIDWETLCVINVGSGSPLAGIASNPLHMEVVGGDIYLCTPSRRLYKIPASALGSMAPDGTMNTLPIAAADQFSDVRVADAFKGPLANDSDADKDAFYAELVSPPASGTIDFRYNGTFDYSPATQVAGSTSFTYRVFDGVGYSAPATVTLNYPVQPLPTKPTQLDTTGMVIFGDDHAGDSNQDASGSTTSAISISTFRYAATISGNAWKRFPVRYTVTANTVLEFSLDATDVGEILGVVLDDNTVATDNRRGFIVGGSDFTSVVQDPWVWNVPGLERYTVGMGMKTYTIPVGTFFTGQVNFLLLVGDDDAGSGSTSATFSSIRLREGASPQTYAQWKAGVDWGTIPELQRGPGNDPDGDGRTNASERAFGGNPASPDRSQSDEFVISRNPDGSRMLKTFYHKAAPEMSYILQHSTTLGSWADVTTGSELFDSTKGLHYRTWVAPSDEPRGFTRIKAVDAP